MLGNQGWMHEYFIQVEVRPMISCVTKISYGNGEHGIRVLNELPDWILQLTPLSQ